MHCGSPGILKKVTSQKPDVDITRPGGCMNEPSQIGCVFIEFAATVLLSKLISHSTQLEFTVLC